MRIARKTASFAVVHFWVAFAATRDLTGSWVLGGLIALVEPLCNTVAFGVHEALWQRMERRRRPGPLAA